MNRELNLSINPEIRGEAAQINERHAALVIDDFLLNPEDVVEYATAHHSEFIELERSYPGKVLPVENMLVEPLNRFIRNELSKLFGFLRGNINFHTQISLTTLQPENFTWIQRLCHTDPRLSPERRNFAALLYLFRDETLGGTGFYQWRDVDYWHDMYLKQVDDPEGGLDELQEKFEMFRQPACYMTESNDAAELLDQVPARFNRLVFYSGDLPHSAFIQHPEKLHDDPARGRLTLNCFVSALPAG